MKLRSKAGGAAAAAVIFGLLVPAMAQAEADTPSVDDLTPQQVQAIDAWEGTEVNTSSVAPTEGALAARASSGTNSMKLYRGSWLMWGEERVTFGWASPGKVTWSDAYQASGAVFPNNVTTKGSKRYYATSARHDWRGTYVVGAGVPTPWGNANVYNATSVAHSRVLNTGSYQWWEG